jgi:hypothetical protein
MLSYMRDLLPGSNTVRPARPIAAVGAAPYNSDSVLRLIVTRAHVRWRQWLRVMVLAGALVAETAVDVHAQSSSERRSPTRVSEDLAVSGAPGARDASVFAARQLLHQIEDDREYKLGEPWWSRNFRGVDFLEPLIPLVAASADDFGSIALGSVLPYALLTTAFAAESTDQATLTRIGRWDWAGIDEEQDNHVVQACLIALGAVGIFLPSRQVGGEDHGKLVLDRAIVFVLGFGTAYGATEILKGVLDRRRPNDDDSRSRPSAHATAGFAAMTFLSNVLRDALAPHQEPHLGFRILKEVATALPYLGAGYLALERVHGEDHFLTDTLLGGAIGAISMNMFYAWSFTRSRYDTGWLERISVGYDRSRRGVQILVHGRF